MKAPPEYYRNMEKSSFFGSFGQLAVQAAQNWDVFGRQPW